MARADDRVRTGHPQRQPARRLGDVEQHPHAVPGPGLEQGVDVGDPAVRGLHDRHRDEVVRPRVPGQRVEPDLGDPHAAAALGGERAGQAGELAGRDQDPGAVRYGGGQRTDQAGHRRALRDVGDRHPHQVGEAATGELDLLVDVARRGRAGRPGPDRVRDGVRGLDRRDARRRRVEVTGPPGERAAERVHRLHAARR